MSDWEQYSNDARHRYELSGYSLKQLFGLIFSGSIGLVFAITLLYIAWKLLDSIPSDIIELAGIMFIFGIIGLLLVGGAIAMIVGFTYVRRPGVQAPGALGKIEKKLGLD